MVTWHGPCTRPAQPFGCFLQLTGVVRIELRNLVGSDEVIQRIDGILFRLGSFRVTLDPSGATIVQHDGYLGVQVVLAELVSPVSELVAGWTFSGNQVVTRYQVSEHS